MKELKKEKREVETGFITYLESKILDAQKEEQKLIQEERKDEANLLKIKINIYEIAKTLFHSAKKEKLVNDSFGVLEQEEFEAVYEEICKNFLEKMIKTPSNWKISLEKAKRFGDVEKQLIEEIKLATAEKIITVFKKMSNV